MQNTNLQDLEQEKLYSIGEASEYLGISIDTLRRWERKGKIDPLRSPGGHRYFRKLELDKLFGTKYEREKETKPRNIIKTSDIETSIRANDTTVSSTSDEVYNYFPQIVGSEPKVISIPENIPIRIIQEKNESFEITTNTPEKIEVSEVNISKQALIETTSILNPPHLSSIGPKEIETPPKVQKEAPKNNFNLKIIGAISLTIVSVIITILFILTQSTHKIVSPLP